MGRGESSVEYVLPMVPMTDGTDPGGIVFDFYHNLNHFYGALTDFCTLQHCPTMSAGPTLVVSEKSMLQLTLS